MDVKTTTPKEIRSRKWDEYIDLLKFFEKRRVPIKRYMNLYFPTVKMKFRGGAPQNTESNIRALKALKDKVIEITAIYETR